MVQWLKQEDIGKRELSDDSDSGGEDKIRLSKRRKENDDRVQRIVSKLKEKHGEQYTMMQYRIWAESIHGGVHESRNDPPATSMFCRAGRTSTCTSSKKSSDSMSAAISQLASALTPKSAKGSTSVIDTAC